MVLIVLSSISVMGAVCQKWETDTVSSTDGPSSLEMADTYDEFSFGFTEIVTIDGVYGVNDNYDHCIGGDYLNEYSCDGTEPRGEIVECVRGCETIDYSFGQVSTPFGRCIPGEVDEPEEDPEVLLNTCTPEEDLKAEILDIKAEFFEYTKARKEVSMQTGIDYYNDLGIDTTDLVAYKDEFLAATDKESARDAITKFREAAQVINNDNGIVDETLEDLKQLLKDAKENDANLQLMIAEIETMALDHRLHFFDTRVCIFTNAFNKLEADGVDVSALSDGLAAISDKRDEYDAAIVAAQLSCDRGIDACDSEEALFFKELRNEIKSLFDEMREKMKTAKHDFVEAQKVEREANQEALGEQIEENKEMVADDKPEGVDVEAKGRGFFGFGRDKEKPPEDMDPGSLGEETVEAEIPEDGVEDPVEAAIPEEEEEAEEEEAETPEEGTNAVAGDSSGGI